MRVTRPMYDLCLGLFLSLHGSHLEAGANGSGRRSRVKRKHFFLLLESLSATAPRSLS